MGASKNQGPQIRALKGLLGRQLGSLLRRVLGDPPDLIEWEDPLGMGSISRGSTGCCRVGSGLVPGYSWVWGSTGSFSRGLLRDRGPSKG